VSQPTQYIRIYINIYPKITYQTNSNAIIFTKQKAKLTNYAKFNNFCNHRARGSVALY